MVVAQSVEAEASVLKNGRMNAGDFVDFLVGAAIKDNATDLRRMNHYFETEVALKEGELWQAINRRWRETFRA